MQSNNKLAVSKVNMDFFIYKIKIQITSKINFRVKIFIKLSIFNNLLMLLMVIFSNKNVTFALRFNRTNNYCIKIT